MIPPLTAGTPAAFSNSKFFQRFSRYYQVESQILSYGSRVVYQSKKLCGLLRKSVKLSYVAISDLLMRVDHGLFEDNKDKNNHRYGENRQEKFNQKRRERLTAQKEFQICQFEPEHLRERLGFFLLLFFLHDPTA